MFMRPAVKSLFTAGLRRLRHNINHFSIVSHATVMGHGGFIVDGTNIKMEFLVKKEGATEAAASH